MSKFFQVTKNLNSPMPRGRQLVITLLITSLLFIVLWHFFPLTNVIRTDHYAFLEYFSTHLLISLVGTLLLAEKVIKNSDSNSSTLLGAALGMLVFINLFGLKMVDPTQITWLMRGDWEWQFLGWHIFRHEEWQFPVGKMTGFWYPVGTSIGYTDSIPWLALLLKPVSTFLPGDFQYIGLWLFSCFTLQGIFAALLLRQACKILFLQTLGILFFLLTPILIHRLGHPALCAHWLLLAALWLYLKHWHNFPLSPSRQLGSWLLLTSLSAATHPYLAVMVLGLAIAFYSRVWLVEHQPVITSALLPMVTLGLVTLLIWWQVGYFLLGHKNMELFGVGHYSMNLLSPLNAMGSGSVLFRDMPFATAGQYEGLNYLGAGVLVLGLWAGYELTKRFVQQTTLKYFLPLFVVCFFLTLLAISNKVTLGSLVLLEFQDNLVSVLSMFRATGRFFWPVHYLLVFMVITVLMRRNSPWTTFTFLSFGVTLQVIDLWPIYQSHRQVRENPAFHWNPNLPTWENPLHSNFWHRVAQHYQHFTLLPPIACGEEAAPYQPFAYLAGHYGLTINTGHLARFDAEQTSHYCHQLLADFQTGVVDHESIYIVHPNFLSSFQKNARFPVVCANIDGFDICVTKDSYLRWKGDNIEYGK